MARLQSQQMPSCPSFQTSSCRVGCRCRWRRRWLLHVIRPRSKLSDHCSRRGVNVASAGAPKVAQLCCGRMTWARRSPDRCANASSRTTQIWDNSPMISNGSGVPVLNSGRRKGQSCAITWRRRRQSQATHQTIKAAVPLAARRQRGRLYCFPVSSAGHRKTI
eukprot:SAG31_NODE_7419_length_1693_cov_2.010665_1_plen_163_part_00